MLTEKEKNELSEVMEMGDEMNDDDCSFVVYMMALPYCMSLYVYEMQGLFNEEAFRMVIDYKQYSDKTHDEVVNIFINKVIKVFYKQLDEFRDNAKAMDYEDIKKMALGNEKMRS